jgi:hypothetical protein
MALVIFDSFAERNAWWVRLAFLTVAMFGLAGRSRLELANAGQLTLADVAEDAPWLKLWVCVWAAAIAVAAIYITKNSIDISSLGFFRVMLIPLALVLAPFVILNERRKFKELGEMENAT